MAVDAVAKLPPGVATGDGNVGGEIRSCPPPLLNDQEDETYGGVVILISCGPVDQTTACRESNRAGVLKVDRHKYGELEIKIPLRDKS